MRHLLVLAVSLALGAAAMFGLAASRAAEALPSPIVTPQDSCMCGGQITYTYHHQETYSNRRDCWYEGRAPNGSIVNYLIRSYSLVQTCPSTP